VRLAELVAALSLGIDLGFGQPMEHVLRQCLIALRIAERLELDQEERSVVYYTALLVNVGCHSDAHEQAKWFGDDIALKARKYGHELGSKRAAATTLLLVGAGNPPLHRFRVGLKFAVSGHRELDGMIAQHAQLARGLAERLGLPDSVLNAVGGAYEQWDGHGWPGAIGGEQVPIAARIAQLAEFVEVAQRLGGPPAACALALHRSGRQFDPRIAALITENGGRLLEGLDDAQTWDQVIGSEPALAVTLTEVEFDEALLAIADFVDLKSPYLMGHARAVAQLARAAGGELGMPPGELHLLYRAGLVHGWGRLGVSNAIWDKNGPLSPGEWERARTYPYLTERMVRQSEALAPVAAVAAQHRERLDGSGYPWGLSGGAISRPARVLGAAEAYQTKLEPRPHRPACSPDEAAAHVRGETRAGRLDAAAAEAVLRSAGHRVRRGSHRPAGLTVREVEVLTLLARGWSNRQIAARLVIAPKTARNHVEHIYTKVGVSSRAAAGLFAMQSGLLPEEPQVSAQVR
jgi:HD-GYP domain-containing protein (c-di-GMP phosphodiesterase class II)